MANLRFSEALGRPIRIDEPPEELGRSTLLEISDAIDRGDGEAAKSLLESFRYEQQAIQDIYVDWIWAMLTWVQQEIDEPAVERIMRETLGSWAGARYANYLDLSFDERLALTVEGMRGHLSGPGRLGSIDVIDEGNRVVVAFDPCGSGGRARRGDPARGIPPATERPEFGDSEEAHDWTWGQRRRLPLLLPLLADQRDPPDRAAGLPDARDRVPASTRRTSAAGSSTRIPGTCPPRPTSGSGSRSRRAEELEAIWERARGERAG